MTQGDGTYEMIVPVAGRYRVNLSAPGQSLPLPQALREIVVPEAESFRFDVALPDVALKGLVIAADTQKPLARARIVAVGDSGETTRVSTQEDGRFELAVAAGRYQLRVDSADYVAEESVLNVVVGQSPERTFRLRRGGTIKLRAVAVGGAPLKEPLMIALSSEGRVVRGKQGGEDGAAELDGLTAGEYRVLVAGDDGFALQAGLAPGQPAVTVPTAPGGIVRLQVKGADGRALAETPIVVELLRWNGVTVALGRVISYSRARTSDAQGWIELALPAGKVEVAAYTRDRKHLAQLGLEVTAPGMSAVATLQPAR